MAFSTSSDHKLPGCLCRKTSAASPAWPPWKQYSPAPRRKPSLKKTAVKILTKLDTMSGRLDVSAIKPASITNASVAPGLKPSARSIAITIGVRISAAPSLVNSDAATAPNRTIYVNNNPPLPPPQPETCSAAHSASG